MTAESAAPKSVAYAYAAMAATTLASTVLPVPVYVHMMVMAMGTIHIGSYSSMTKEMKEVTFIQHSMTSSRQTRQDFGQSSPTIQIHNVIAGVCFEYIPSPNLLSGR